MEKTGIFCLWLDGPHLIVDLSVTLVVDCCTVPHRIVARLSLLVAAYHFIQSLDTASGVIKAVI